MPFKTLLKKYKHLLVMLLIFCIGGFCFGWVGYENLRESAGTSQREIINDDYSVISSPIEGAVGVKQNILVEKGKSLYGVNLKFHTYNKVCHGTVFVDLLNENGEILAHSSDDMTTVLNDTFKRFIFDKTLVSDSNRSYTLHVYTTPKAPWDKIALWKSEVAKTGFSLEENSAKTNGTLALQYITRYVGGFIYTAYFAVAAFLMVFLLGLYCILFIKKAKLHNVFAFCAVCIGLVFCFFTPQRGAPDEYVHIASSYYNASRILSVQAVDANGDLLMRPCDATPLNRTSKYNAFDWQETYQGLFIGAGEKGELVPVKANIVTVFPPLYFAQTLGVLVARILNLGYIPMLLLGRIFNLLLYVVLVYLAIKAMPFFKTPLCLISLLPIPLQLAGSFSYDTLVVGLCFLFIALCFKYSYMENKISKKQIAILALLVAIIAPSKTIYITVTAFCFIIPRAKFSSVKNSYIAKSLIIVAALSMWLAYNSGLVSNTFSDIGYTASTGTSVETDVGEKVNEDKDLIGGHIQENGDSVYYFTFGYMLTHIPQTTKLVINSFQDDFPLYIQGLLGGRLGEIIVSPVEISWVYMIALIIILLLSTFPVQGQSLRYRGLAKWWGMLIAVGACGLAALACITWTPINYTHIFGLQGRYFLPVFPLILLFFSGEKISVKKSIDSILIFALCCVDILILLDAFTIMAVGVK